MINFSQFLAESQNYPLYHGTGIDELAKIIISNEIKTGVRDDPHHWPSKTFSIISTSRNYNFSKNWAREQNSDSSWVVIELDRAKLKNNYKIVPFNYFGSDATTKKPKARWPANDKRYLYDIDRNQYEEAITKNIKPALEYIKFVYMSEKTQTIFKKLYSAEYSLLIRHGLI